MGQGGAQALSAPWGGQATKAEGLESLSGPSEPGRELESSRNMGVGVAWARCSQVRVSCFRCSALKRPLWLWNLLGVDRSPRPHPEYHAGHLARGLRVTKAHRVILELLTGRCPPGGLLCPKEVLSH